LLVRQEALSLQLSADQPVDHVVADEVDLGLTFRLRIGEENDIEFLRFIDLLQREVNDPPAGQVGESRKVVGCCAPLDLEARLKCA
jgi:hypothetical protein